MALLISNAILHMISNSGTGPHISNGELDVDSETCQEFIGRHVRRLMNNPAAKEATFAADSPVYGMVKAFQKRELQFRDFSQLLCERLAAIMQENRDIPPADLLVTAFDNRKQSYLAILKLNYGECFTHRIREEDGGCDIQIVKNTAVLPFSGGKVEEACLIPYDSMVLRILEKPYPVGGEETNYFSQLFLECETEMSRKETAEIIQMVTEEINTKYYSGDVEKAAAIQCAVIEEAEQAGDDGIVLDNVARRAFPEREEAAAEFVSLARESGLPHEVQLDKPFVQREFKVQRFKADNGIEIKCPTELFRDPETVQITTNGDGTISVTLKNLRRGS